MRLLFGDPPKKVVDYAPSSKKLVLKLLGDRVDKNGVVKVLRGDVGGGMNKGDRPGGAIIQRERHINGHEYECEKIDFNNRDQQYNQQDDEKKNKEEKDTKEEEDLFMNDSSLPMPLAFQSSNKLIQLPFRDRMRIAMEQTDFWTHFSQELRLRHGIDGYGHGSNSNSVSGISGGDSHHSNLLVSFPQPVLHECENDSIVGEYRYTLSTMVNHHIFTLPENENIVDVSVTKRESHDTRENENKIGIEETRGYNDGNSDTGVVVKDDHVVRDKMFFTQHVPLFLPEIPIMSTSMKMESPNTSIHIKPQTQIQIQTFNNH